jgi:hypothetical protein
MSNNSQIEKRNAGTIHRFIVDKEDSKNKKGISLVPNESTPLIYNTDTHKGFVQDFYFNRLDFCDCGTHGESLRVIRNLVNWHHHKMANNLTYKENQRELHATLDYAVRFTGSDSVFSRTQMGITQILLSLLNKVGVLEHGGGIHNSWLTLYGNDLRNHLNAIPDDELNDLL